MAKDNEILVEELGELEQNIEKLVKEFHAKHIAVIPKSHKLSVELTASYDPNGCVVYCNADINKRQKSWNEMIRCELTKRDWKKIYKCAFFSPSNRLGNTQASRFYDHLKKLETGSDKEITIDHDNKYKRWVVGIKETDRTQINRLLDIAGLQQYGLVNYGTRYGDSSVIMAKFW